MGLRYVPMIEDEMVRHSHEAPNEPMGPSEHEITREMVKQMYKKIDNLTNTQNKIMQKQDAVASQKDARKPVFYSKKNKDGDTEYFINAGTLLGNVLPAIAVGTLIFMAGLYGVKELVRITDKSMKK